MPIAFARRLTGSARSPASDRHLGYSLAFIAGGMNAGGYQAVRQYTSHMTGVASSLSYGVASAGWTLAFASAMSLLAFVAGAMACTLLIRMARQRRMHSEYALPLVLESILLLAFGLSGTRPGASSGLSTAATVILLCFVMGLQNALITKVSRAEIRTTHMTGIVTDLGIELGRALFQGSLQPASRLTLYGCLLLAFIAGGIAGTIAFRWIGDLATVPLASMLVACALVPVVDDARAWTNSQGARR